MTSSTRTKILLVCPEPLGHGQPAGVGIRFLEFAKLLTTAGHPVTLLSRDAAAIPGCHTGGLDGETIRDESRDADAIVVQGHAANDVFELATPRPTVVDLYDPYLIENLHYAKDGLETFAHDHATLVRSMKQGDFFLCASEIQRTFYLGIFLALGRLNPERFLPDPDLRSLIDLVPFGVPEPLPEPGAEPPDALLFGGIYDWYDPRPAVDAVAIARETIPELSLTFTTHPNAEITPQGVFAETREYVKSRGWESFIRFEPWIPYGDRARHYRRFGAAIVTFQSSFETSLAMRTRVFDFLWAGLPVVTSSSPGTDELIRRFGAGIVVDDNDPSRLASAVVEALTNREKRAELLSGGRSFTSAHQWNALAAPLLRFLREPKVDESKSRFRSGEGRIAVPPPTIVDRVKRRLRRRG